MNEFVIKNGYIAQNNSVVSGSLTVTNGITGGITGTASYASQADSASYATLAISASHAVSSSYAVSASSAVSAASATSSSYATLATTADTASSADNFLVRGNLTAQTLVVQTITSSVVYSSGSNIFGNSVSNTQEFTGSVSVTGSLTVLGNPVILANQTSSMSVLSSSYASASTSASYAVNATTSSTALILQNNSSTVSSSTSIYTSGSSLLYNLSAFKGAIIDYVVSTSGSGDSIRGGTFTAVWNAVSSSANEVTTVDIGNTDNVQFSADATGSVFVNITSGSWVVDSLYRALGTAIVVAAPVYPFTLASLSSTSPSLACSNGFGGGTETVYASTNTETSITNFFTDAGLTVPFVGDGNAYLFMYNYPSGTSYAAYIDASGNLTSIQECPPPLDYNNYNFGPDRASGCAGPYGTKSIGVPTGDTIGTASIIYGTFTAMGGAGATFYVGFDNGGTQSTRGFVINAGLATATPSEAIVAC